MTGLDPDHTNSVIVKMAHVAAALCLVILLGGAEVSRAAGYEPIIGIIDSGVSMTHQEFSQTQFVAWWDFSEDRGAADNPVAGQTWDWRGGRHPSAPFDPYGHGTAVASMAAGLNASGRSSQSVAPGYKLAVAKVADAHGRFSGDISAAIYWMVDTVHADVINMSFSFSTGIFFPSPSIWYHRLDAAVAHAHDKGVTITVANGNGLADSALVPTPGDATDPSDLPQVISVGASGSDGPFTNSDPMVTAVFNAHVAQAYDPQGAPCDTCYGVESGTSFSAPFVAGFAARLIKASKDSGHSSSPDYIKQLVEYSAKQTSYPPSVEGYGEISGSRLQAAYEHAIAHTLPAADPVRKLYVDAVAGSVRSLFGA